MPWWYRAPLPESATAAVAAGGRAILTFKGINYRANVWVGGQQLASSSVVEGAYNYHDLDITDAVREHNRATSNAGANTATNASPAVAVAVAVEVFRSYDYGLDCEQADGLPMNEQVSCRGRPV